MSTVNILGDKIRTLRRRLDMPAERFFEAIGGEGTASAARSIVYQYEKGVKRPGPERLKAIADLAGCSVEWLQDDNVIREVAEEYSAPASPPDHSLLDMLARQQDLLTRQQDMMAEQQAMLERQRQDVARLTELLARQQEASISEREFQQQLIRQSSSFGRRPGSQQRVYRDPLHLVHK